MSEEDIMEVSRYLFQSPSPNQVQIGRLDPSVSKESTSKNSETIPDEISNKAKNFQATQINEVLPSVESLYKLDVYA